MGNYGGCVAGGVSVFVNVRWPCPRTQLSVWGTGEDGSFWCPCTDSAPGAFPHSCRQEEEEASPEISAGADVVWSGSPCRGCVSFQSVLAWWCLRRSMASGASEDRVMVLSELQLSCTL